MRERCILSGMNEKSHDLEYLNDAAKAVDALLPDHHGYIIMAVPFAGGDKRLKYTSNLTRENAVKILKEFLIQACGEEDWMRHIK